MLTRTDTGFNFSPVTLAFLARLPAPGIISDSALKDAAYHDQSGILVAYDRANKVGGMINTRTENPVWVLKTPVDELPFIDSIIETLHRGTVEYKEHEMARH